MARWVSRTYGLPMITEVARSVLAELETHFETLRTDMDQVAEYQKRVFQRQMDTERLQEQGFVSDRAFDNLAYAADHTTILKDIMDQEAGKQVRDYMEWVNQGVVFFIRPHRSLLKEDGVRAGVDWESVIRIDGMVKLMLEQFGIRYLPIDTPSMQERVRAVEFVLSRSMGMTQQLGQDTTEYPQRIITLVKNG